MTSLRRRGGSESEQTSDPSISFTSSTYTIPTSSSTTQFTEFTQEETMTCRDRTNEFMLAVKSFQGRQVNGAVPSLRESRKGKSIQQYSEFMRIAK